MKGTLNLWLVAIVAVCALSYGFGKDLLQRPATDPAGSRASEQPIDFGPAEPETPVHLLVLNGTDHGGLARDVGLLLGRAGCVVDQLGNAPHDRYASSFLVNRRLGTERAERLAAALGGLRILQEFDGRTAVDAVLVLGRDVDKLRRCLEES